MKHMLSSKFAFRDQCHYENVQKKGVMVDKAKYFNLMPTFPKKKKVHLHAFRKNQTIVICLVPNQHSQQTACLLIRVRSFDVDISAAKGYLSTLGVSSWKCCLFTHFLSVQIGFVYV